MLYLVDMLTSFTKIESYAISIRVRKGAWKKIRFSDLDIHSLISNSLTCPHGQYSRIAGMQYLIGNTSENPPAYPGTSVG
jgi:hypothetical protein